MQRYVAIFLFIPEIFHRFQKRELIIQLVNKNTRKKFSLNRKTEVTVISWMSTWTKLSQKVFFHSFVEFLWCRWKLRYTPIINTILRLIPQVYILVFSFPFKFACDRVYLMIYSYLTRTSGNHQQIYKLDLSRRLRHNKKCMWQNIVL